MAKRVLGIDFGATTTDFVWFGGKGIEKTRATPAIPLERLGQELARETRGKGLPNVIAVTGGRSWQIKDGFSGFEVKRIEEVEAIAAGGLFESGLNEAIVVSMGTGTCIVKASGGKAEHLCGTGIGGGTIIGLSKLLVGEEKTQKIRALAAKGDPSRVNLTIEDVLGKGFERLPSSATASNFAKAGRHKREDLAAATIRMVAESVAMLTAMACRAAGISKAVLVGKASGVKGVREVFEEGGLIYGFEARLSRHHPYASALGACLEAQKKKQYT